MEYTKGEWKAYKADKDRPWLVRIQGEYGLEPTIADIVGIGKSEKEQKANANLIASAPDLYAVLERAVNDPYYVLSGDWYTPAKQALAKAGGK